MKKKNIIIIIAFIVAIIATATITVIIVNNKYDAKNKNNEIFKDEEKTNQEIENKTDETTVPDTNIEVSEEIKTESKPNKEDKKENNTNADKNSHSSIKEPETPKVEETPKTENDVINYVSKISTEEKNNSLKDGFVKVIDFIFYDGEIYGKTFKGLSNSAKIKIIAFALKIDSKIDEYFPGYKESISSTTNRIYTNLKNKLVTLYLDTTVVICNNNETLCADAKAGLTELKSSFGLTWDFIKDISGIGITKLKDWYEIWRAE